MFRAMSPRVAGPVTTASSGTKPPRGSQRSPCQQGRWINTDDAPTGRSETAEIRIPYPTSRVNEGRTWGPQSLWRRGIRTLMVTPRPAVGAWLMDIQAPVLGARVSNEPASVPPARSGPWKRTSDAGSVERGRDRAPKGLSTIAPLAPLARSRRCSPHRCSLRVQVQEYLREYARSRGSGEALLAAEEEGNVGASSNGGRGGGKGSAVHVETGSGIILEDFPMKGEATDRSHARRSRSF